MAALEPSTTRAAFLFSKFGNRRGLFLAIGVLFVLAFILSVSIDTRDYSPRASAHRIKESIQKQYGNSIGNTYKPENAAYMHAGYDRPGYELPLADGIPLRILPVGASTTKGQLSFDDNGYRKPLRDWLTAAGNPVNFVGSMRDGNMTDNDHEGQNGARLDLMYHRMVAEGLVTKTQPNVVIVALGTNDVMQDYKLDTLYHRYWILVSYILSVSPRATIIMCTLTVVREHYVWNLPGTRVPIANAQIRKMAKLLQAEGKPVVLAELEGPLGVQPESLQWDDSHPNDAGYALMGSIIYRAIVEADAKGFLQDPLPVSEYADDGDAERVYDGIWVSDVTRDEERRRVEAEKAEEKEIKDMMKSLNEFWKDAVKNGKPLMPKDPPVDPPMIPGLQPEEE